MSNKVEMLKELYPEDLYGFTQKLSEGEVEVLYELRKALEKHLDPIIAESWNKADFPFDEFYKVIEDVHIMNDPRLFEGRDEKYKASEFYIMGLYLELARFDASIATFFTVHGGLGFNTVLLGGNERQIEEFAPKIMSFEWQTCFALTEPDHGSDIAGGLATTAERDGDEWILNGEKRWIGGSDTADIIPVFARDTEDNQVKCFMVRKDAEGYEASPIPDKVSLRPIRNGHISIKNVRVAEEDRLQNINSFKDVARILTFTRADVAHIAMGVTAGAFVGALDYTKKREQFNKPVAGYQLVQEKLARMQSNVVTTLAYSSRIAEMQEEGNAQMLNSSLAKMSNSLHMRETVSLAREVCGGNGITLGSKVARFFADAEAIYTYEGSHEINTLIVGRAITGLGAFV